MPVIYKSSGIILALINNLKIVYKATEIQTEH